MNKIEIYIIASSLSPLRHTDINTIYIYIYIEREREREREKESTNL